MRLLSLLARFWIFLAFPIGAAALALIFVLITGGGHRATTELAVDPRSEGLTSMLLPNLPNTSLVETEEGVRIAARGSSPKDAAEKVRHMANLLINSVSYLDIAIDPELDDLNAGNFSAEVNRERLEQFNIANVTLQSYADALQLSDASTWQGSPGEDLALRASALVDVLRLMQSNRDKALLIDRRLRDPIPAQPISVEIVAIPLSPLAAIVSGLLGGLFAAFVVSALLAFSRKNPTWPGTAD